MKRISLILAVMLVSQIVVFSAVVNRSENVFAYSQSAAVMEKRSGRLLYAENENERKSIASLTKIITAITAIENANLSKEITVEKEWCGIEGSSIYLREGEKLTLKELLYGLMLRSGNDAATAIAASVGGDNNGFSKLMNDTAKKAGAQNSNFVNPHGLEAEGHYSTALDMARICALAMNNNAFQEIVGTKYIEIRNGDEGKRYLKNKNKLLFDSFGATGIKTGYTKVAGRCLASSAAEGETEVVCVVLSCGPMFEYSKSLLVNALKCYEYKKFVDKKEYFEDNCPLYIENDFSYCVKKEGEEIEVRCDYDTESAFPIEKGKKFGEMKIYLEKELIFSQNIYTILDVKNRNEFERILSQWSLCG